MTIELTNYEKSVIIQALIDYKQKIIGYGSMTEKDKDLIRSLYKDINKIIKKLN